MDAWAPVLNPRPGSRGTSAWRVTNGPSCFLTNLGMGLCQPEDVIRGGTHKLLH